MTQYTSTNPKQIVEAFSDIKSKKIQGFSRHIDEIFPNLSKGKSSQIKIAFELYAELIKQYKTHSSDYMAILVIGTDFEDDLKKHSLQELLVGKLELYPPPELHLAERIDERNMPFIMEEYKVPVKQEVVEPSTGVVYAYYKTIRSDQDDIYLPGFYFEHYPDLEAEDIVHDWE